MMSIKYHVYIDGEYSATAKSGAELDALLYQHYQNGVRITAIGVRAVAVLGVLGPQPEKSHGTQAG